MTRALKVTVTVWIVFLSPLTLVAFLTQGLWVPQITADPAERLMWGVGLFALLLSGYLPWIIGERLARSGAAKAPGLAARSVVQSGAAVQAR